MGDRRFVAEAALPALSPIRTTGSALRVAVISMHTSPTAPLGHSANGGMNVYVREVCAALARRGVATDIFTRLSHAQTPFVERLSPLSRVVYLPAGRPDLDKYRLLGEVPGFAERVRDFIEDSGLAYHLIYSHYWLSGVAACSLRRWLRLPWVHIAHTLAVVKNKHLAPEDRPEPEVRVDLEGEIARCADLLAVSTEAEAEALRRAYGVRPERLAVVAPGCDQRHFRPRPREESRRRIGHPGERLFLFVGRLERLKGVEVALRAMALLVASGRYPQARLLVLGEDSWTEGESERRRLVALTEELGLVDRVTFEGAVPQARLPDYYCAADACLLPSYSESFGLVGLEAQACGTPLIASRAAGMATVVHDAVTGFLVEGQDPAAYATWMGRLLDEPGLVERMGARAARMVRRFSWEATADGMLRRFHELVEGDRRLPRDGLAVVADW